MILRSRTAGLVVALLVSLSAGAVRADQDALLEQMTAFNKAAVAAYSEGDFDKAKAQLLKAVAIAKKDSELQAHPMMARTFLHLGVLYVDGFEDRKTGVKFFEKALKIRPDIQVSDALATRTVKSAFDEANGQSAGEAATTEVAADQGSSADTEEKPSKMTAKQAAAEKKRLEAEMRQSEKQAAAEKRREELEAREAERQAAAEARLKDRESKDEKNKLLKELAQTGESEAKERTAKEKLLQEKQQRDELLAEAKTALKQFQREKQEAEKQAAKEKQENEKARADNDKRTQAEKDKLEKELAQLKDSDAKERAAKEKALAEKADKEKLLAQANATIQQLQKEKSDRDKLIAQGTDREKKEREAKEKLEKDRQMAESRDKERKAREEADRQERERLAAGPDMPSHFSEPVYCAMPDEVQAGQDLYVHCASKSSNAKEIAFYYRASGGVLYNAVTLQPSKKGWHAAVIPAEKVTGKTLQYYTEARDKNGGLVATTGKAASPNILSVKQGGASLTAQGRRGGTRSR